MTPTHRWGMWIRGSSSFGQRKNKMSGISTLAEGGKEPLR